MKAKTNKENPRKWAGLHRSDVEFPDIAIVGLPYDGAACFRTGASEGPDRIRSLSSKIPPVLETGENLKGLSIRDDGNIPFGSDFVASFPSIEEGLAKRLDHSFLLTLGGDHSISIPVHRTFSNRATKKIGLVFIDAHTDLSDQFEGSPYSNGCPLRRAMEAERFSAEETILVGTRCFEPDGLKFIKDHNMKTYPAYELADRGMTVIATEIVKRFGDLSNVYLSIDIDVLDPAFAPGTGIPDAGGLTTRDLITLIRMLDPLPIVGADLVEVAPRLDSSDITSFAALRIIMELFGLVYRRKSRKERTTLL